MITRPDEQQARRDPDEVRSRVLPHLDAAELSLPLERVLAAVDRDGLALRRGRALWPSTGPEQRESRPASVISREDSERLVRVAWNAGRETATGSAWASSEREVEPVERIRGRRAAARGGCPGRWVCRRASPSRRPPPVACLPRTCVADAGGVMSVPAAPTARKSVGTMTSSTRTAPEASRTMMAGAGTRSTSASVRSRACCRSRRLAPAATRLRSGTMPDGSDSRRRRRGSLTVLEPRATSSPSLIDDRGRCGSRSRFRSHRTSPKRPAPRLASGSGR